MVTQNEIKKSKIYNIVDSIYTASFSWWEVVVIFSARWHSQIMLFFPSSTAILMLIIGAITCFISICK